MSMISGTNAQKDHDSRIASIPAAPTEAPRTHKAAEIRGAAVKPSETTDGRFYQRVMKSTGNVYFLRRDGFSAFSGAPRFVIVDVELGDRHHDMRTMRGEMAICDEQPVLLYKFTQHPSKVPQPAPEPEPFPRYTRSKDIGAKVGDKFVVVIPAAFFRPGTVVTLVEDDGTVFPYFSGGNTLREPCHWHRLARLPQPVAEPVKPIPAGLQIGDRVRYDATQHHGGQEAQHGVLGTVVNRLDADSVEVKWDNGWNVAGNAAVCCVKVSPDAVSADEAHQILADDETYALSNDEPVLGVIDVCKQRIDAARSRIAQLESDLRVEQKVLADAQGDLQNELKGYLPE